MRLVRSTGLVMCVCLMACVSAPSTGDTNTSSTPAPQTSATLQPAAEPEAASLASPTEVPKIQGTKKGTVDDYGDVGTGLTAAQIRGVIRSHIGEVASCHAKSADQSASGKVSVKFLITPEGTVGSASIAQTSFGQPAVEACVKSVVEGLQFPKASGPVVITYPFKLEPGPSARN